MYTSEYLARYPFFRQLLEEMPAPAMHDSLTGLIARPFILRFIQALIEERTPFAMAIVDLDNFKSINDNYGHRTGDEMLARVAADLSRYLGESGVAGRYGGDEFLIVYFDRTDYDGVHAFLDGMYFEGDVFRRNLLLRGRTIFSTATIGCAVYPKDADSFEGLFALADKTLYRGKSKGRNCFILYVPAKHAHLEIPTLARRSLYDTFLRIADGFDRGGNAEEKLRLAFQPIRENLRMHRLLYIDAQNRLHDLDAGEAGSVEPTVGLLQRGLYAAHSLDELALRCPALERVLRELGFESVLLSEVSHGGQRFGTLVFCPEAHNLHIWQENESVAAFFLSRLLAQYLEQHTG
jgi:diguanylate cyclase (GGDEF)-like protein